MAQHVIHTKRKLSTIQPEVYGNFSEHLGRCIYEGLYVGEDSAIPNVNGMRTDVVEALKKLHLPVLRWPGGCFADEYHWKDGIGDKSKRKKMINTHWGGVVEDNSFGTHEFFELCRQIGCKPYVNGNVGSGSVQEMNEWIEYMTFDGVSPMAQLRKENGDAAPWELPYFAVGNENWGCGGNMRPEYYADLYRRYQTYVRKYGKNPICKIACGPNAADYHWTEVLMREATAYMDGLSLHYYTVTHDWQKKGSATQFERDELYTCLEKALKIEELVIRHSAIMDHYDPDKRVSLVVDEWGTWHDVEPGTNPGFLYQQNTMRDALVASLTLNVFNKHSDRVRMANIAQTINVLQAVILTDGAKMLLTPTYHVFDLYKVHQGATLLQSDIGFQAVEGTNVPALHESCSIAADGTVSLTLCNLSDQAQCIQSLLSEMTGEVVCAQLLTGAPESYNDFETGSAVVPTAFDSIQTLHVGEDTCLCYTLPACSVVCIQVR